MAHKMIVHYSMCSPDYPEKPKGERPQQLIRMRLNDHEVVYTCSDCGAFIVRKEPRHDTTKA